MKNDQNSNYFWALIFIAGGGLFLMRNFGLLDFNLPIKIISWRLIPLIIGINAILKKDYFGGIIALSIAIAFYIPDFLTKEERLEYYKLWPLLLVGVGLTILGKRFFPDSFEKWGNNTINEDLNYINESNLMAGSSKKFTTQDFGGGRITCIMGGSEVNLIETNIQSVATLNVFILMGGLEMRVPKEWNVKINALPIMGGTEDQINKFPENVVNEAKTLIISGYVVMGGIEIKRY
jgi:hypothetical protein